MKIAVHDCASGKVTEREMTPEEETAYLARCAEFDMQRGVKKPSLEERLAILEAALGKN